jgi:hypothetical protein
MMLAAMTIDKVDPPSGESFKGVDLAGINSVVDDAGNHFDALHRHSGSGFTSTSPKPAPVETVRPQWHAQLAA